MGKQKKHKKRERVFFRHDERSRMTACFCKLSKDAVSQDVIYIWDNFAIVANGIL